MSVLVVGDVIDDILVRPLQPVTPGSDTRAEIRRAPGGSGANQAAWLGWLGAPVSFAGRVGVADVGRHSAALRGHGVHPVLSVDPDRPTGTIVLLVGADGERTMYVERGANPWLQPADLPDDLLDEVRLLHVSGYCLIDEPARSTVLGLVAQAGRRGVPVSVDPGSAAFLREVGPAEFLGWTRGAGLAFPNQDEAVVLTGLDDPGAAAAALCSAYEVVVLTLGAEGAIVAVAGADPVRCPGDPVAALDSTGAGDAFAAGFLHAWLSGPAAGDALDRAVTAAGAGNRVAALALGTLGARPPQRMEDR